MYDLFDSDLFGGGNPPFPFHTPSFSVVAGSTADIDLAVAADPNPIDGLAGGDAVQNGERILLKDQATASENGIYIMVDVTDPTTWTRAPDFDQDIEFLYGAKVFVREGTVNADTTWKLTSDNVVVDTDDAIFTLDSNTAPLAQNTLYVDATYGTATGTVDDPSKPWTAIQAAMTASSVGDKIVVAPGTYAEGLTVPWDLFISAQGASGITSIDISAGVLNGRVGKVEYHANGCIIYPDSSATDNWDALVDACAVAATQSERFSIGLLYSVYDATAGNIDFLTSGYDVIDVYGIGTAKPIIRSSINTGVGIFDNPRTNSFYNLEFNNTSGNATLYFHSLPGSNTGNVRNIDSDGKIFLADQSSTYDGYADNIDGGQIRMNGNNTSTGNLTNIKVSNSTGIEIARFSGVLEVTEGSVTMAQGTMSGTLRVTNGDRISVANSVVVTGKIICQDVGEGLFAGADYQINIDDLDAGAGRCFGDGGIAVLQDGSIINRPVGSVLSESGTVFEPEVVINDMTLNTPTSTTNPYRQTAQELKCQVNGGVVNQNDLTEGFSVSDGAVLNQVSFVGKTTSAADRYKPCLIGRNLLGGWQSTTAGNTFWDDSEKKLVFGLASQPQEGNGAGSHTGIASGTTFNGKIYAVPAASGGGDISAVEGLLGEFEVFNDVGGAIHGKTEWVLRSTDNFAKALDDALASPGADLTPSGALTNNATVAQEMTFTDNGCTFEGIPYGEELTVNKPEEVEVSETSYTQLGHESLLVINDDFALGSAASIASSGTVAAGTTRASIASFPSRASLASTGTIASVASGASIASRPIIASQGTLASNGSITSLASVSSFATAASYGTVGAISSRSDKVSVTMDGKQPFEAVRIGSIAAYVSIESPSGTTLDGKDAALLSQYESKDIFNHKVNFYSK